MNETMKSMWESWWISSYEEAVTLYGGDVDGRECWEDEED